MILSLYQIKCDGCGLGCGGVFSDLQAAEYLRERLGWECVARADEPLRRFDESPQPEVVTFAVAHLCPPCDRARRAAMS
jgi:hypothetical protein